VNQISIMHRHLPHSNSRRIYSELQAHKQLLKHWKEIRLDTHLICSLL